MKNVISCPPLFLKFNFSLVHILLLLGLMICPSKVFTQSIECGVELPDGLIESLIGEIPAIEQFSAQRSSVSTQDVPVRFTVFHGPDHYLGNSQTIANIILSKINQAFAPAGLHFVQCGSLNEVWDDRVKGGIDNFLTSFSYTSGAMEMYFGTDIGGGSSFAAVPLTAWQSGNPNVPYGLEHSNWVYVNPGAHESTFAHEVGHHFGLLHTHETRGKAYDVPTLNENTPDYPYPVNIPNTTPPEIQPWWWGRELAIRNDVPQGTKIFWEQNSNKAGDLVEDTPADCHPGNSSNSPGCSLNAQNLNTCEFDALELTYEDYNGDKIFPPPGGYSLGRNYMSYWRAACLDQFTQGQINRLMYYYETIRKPEYTDKCGQFMDKVEFESSSTGLHNVTIRVRHPVDIRKCNVTTDQDGGFSGTMHEEDLSAYTYHNGQKSTLAYPNDPLRLHYEHTNCEWQRGLSTLDLLMISRHILGIQLLANGYARIAADANRSNSITTFDIVELRKLILGKYERLPQHDQPWRFIPEFIPQDYAGFFDNNPFSMTIGGSYVGAAYLDQGWLFSLPDTYNGKKGFDGIKVGDVNSSWPTSDECPEEMDVPNDAGEKPILTVPLIALSENQVFALTFKVNNFQQVEAFQLGIRLPYEQFEVLEVVDATLPAYTEEDYFGLTKLEENAVRTLWFDENGSSQTLSNNSTLFSLIVRTKQPVSNLQSAIKLDNTILSNQFWRASTATAAPVSLEISVEEASAERANSDNTPLGFSKADIGVLRCSPNPFKNNVQLTFMNNGQAVESDLKINNARGEQIFQQTIHLLAGENTFEVNDLKSLPMGVYWAILTVEGKTYSTKVVKY